MTTSGSPVQSQMDCANNVNDIWKKAIDHYEKTTTEKINTPAQVKSVDQILDDMHEREKSFRSYRHDGSRLEKFRTLVGKSLNPIERVGNIVATAASVSFPPSSAIFTAVQYLIKSVNAVSADYDKIAMFFEDLDLYLNQLKIMEPWIEHVAELRIALAEVLASVLTLCGICLKYTKMKRIVKAFKNLVSGEDEELKKAYAHFHKMVENQAWAVRNTTLGRIEQLRKQTGTLQVDIASALATTKLTHENTKIMVARNQRIDEGLESDKRAKILQRLSSLDFNDKQEDVFSKSHPGTGGWLLNSDEFQNWLWGDQNSILWCPGIAGAGKTIMTSILVDHVEKTNYGKAVAIAYIYCDYKDQKTQSEVELLSSIIRQLAEQMDPLPGEVEAFCDEPKQGKRRRKPTNEERISLLRSICLLFQTTYVFIDALDVCPEDNRENFFQILRQVQSSIRILITSRPSLELQEKFTNVCRLDIFANSSDIQSYLKDEIERNSRLSKLIKTDPELEADIMKTLVEEAAGMFLFAHLQIGRLCRQKTIKKVRANINKSPAGVFAIYEDDMRRIEEQPEEDIILAKKALSYIFCAKRQLNVEELRQALAVEAEDKELDETDVLPDTEDLLCVSGGLIRVDQQSRTIRLVHHTLQEYLEQHPESLLRDFESLIANTCLTYLSFDVFSSGPCKSEEALNRRLQHPNQGRRELLFAYLKEDQKLASSVQVLFLNAYQTNHWPDNFPRHFGPLHISSYWGLDDIVALLLEKGLDINSEKGLDINSEDSQGTTALHLAAKQGHASVVRLLLTKNASFSIANKRGETALYWAARNGHQPVVELLLTYGANVLTKDNEGSSALDWAIIGGKSEIVKELLDKGVDTELDGRNKALYVAAGEGHEDTLQLLLQNGAEVNSKDWLGSTALDFASPLGHEKAVKVLLQNGSNVHSKDNYDNTALHWAVQHERILQLLLDSGAEVNAKNDTGQTALCWAARDGPVAGAELLLKYSSDISIQDNRGCTALHGAAVRGREEMVQLLLAQGADPNIKDNDGWTPLHAAALKQYGSIVLLLLEKVDSGQEILDWVARQQQDARKWDLLMYIAEEKTEGSTVLSGLRLSVQEQNTSRLLLQLEEGADVNAQDIGGWTPLVLAADSGYTDVVQLLIRHEADVNLCGRRGWSALHWASERGQEAAVRTLVEHGAEIDMSRNGWAPLLLAAERNKFSIVRFLAENGADPNMEDYYGRRALHWAAMYGHTTVMRLLLERGAKSNAVDRWGRTALIWAIDNTQQEIALALLSANADVQMTARDGSTALHYAAFNGDSVTVERLLKKGACIDAKTRDGFTALHVAALVECEEVVQQLLVEGADSDAEAQWCETTDSDNYVDGVADALKGKGEVERLTTHQLAGDNVLTCSAVYDTV